MITKDKEDSSLPLIKAIIFDFIGTLTNVKNYSLETSKTKLYMAIVEACFHNSAESFLEAYRDRKSVV